MLKTKNIIIGGVSILDKIRDKNIFLDQSVARYFPFDKRFMNDINNISKEKIKIKIIILAIYTEIFVSKILNYSKIGHIHTALLKERNYKLFLCMCVCVCVVFLCVWVFLGWGGWGLSSLSIFTR